MRIVIFGGTFDPIHLGHLLTARAAMELLKADKALLITAGVSPHKLRTDSASSADRLAMCRLAVEGDSRFLVSDVEVARSGPSYTFDTVSSLEQAYRDAEFTLLMGADQLSKLHTWHRVGELLARVRVAVLGRPGFVMDLSELQRHVPGVDLSRITPLHTPLINISATDIRHRVSIGLPIHEMVPTAVEPYIMEHGLYRT